MPHAWLPPSTGPVLPAGGDAGAFLSALAGTEEASPPPESADPVCIAIALLQILAFPHTTPCRLPLATAQ